MRFDRDIGTTPALMVIQVQETQRRLTQGRIGRVARRQGEPWWVGRGRTLLVYIGQGLTRLGKRSQQVGSRPSDGQAARSKWAAQQR